MRLLVIYTFLMLFSLSATAQEDLDAEAFFIRDIYDNALEKGSSYEWLDYICEHIGPRLSGSPQAAAAVYYTRQMLDTMGLDSVWLQEVQVPHWVRGEKERIRVVNSPTMGSFDLNAVALGNSVGTGPEGLTAEVVRVMHLDDLEKLGRENIEGKIVFFDRPFDQKLINMFHAYGGASDQRVYGPARAGRYGAAGVVIRSLSSEIDDFPHTGVTVYEEGTPKVPAFGISTRDSEVLRRLTERETVTLYLESHCEKLPDEISHNVIGEIRGSEYPDEIILVGGHLDSWDLGCGAHDDATGCVQSMDVLQVLKRIGYEPKRTIRCVLFMNEENGLQGALTYADSSNARKEFHMAAIESDAGGFTPRGFSADAEDELFTRKFKKVTQWLPLLEPYGLRIYKGGSGADISRLKSQGGLLFGLRPDTQRYFTVHHSANDTFDQVNERELKLGVGAMTSLVYLLDKYGLPE